MELLANDERALRWPLALLALIRVGGQMRGFGEQFVAESRAIFQEQFEVLEKILIN